MRKVKNLPTVLAASPFGAVLPVVAVALLSPDGTILVQKRPVGSAMAGLWEFPGGKMEADETPEAALARECREELGITILPEDLKPLTFASETLGSRHLVLLLYTCGRWQGEAIAHHAAELRWVTPDAMKNLAMPPADAPFIDFLRQLAAT